MAMARLANLRLREDLRHQFIRDPLTGLFNRRYLEESLARKISRCQRCKLPIVVMMLDWMPSRHPTTLAARNSL